MNTKSNNWEVKTGKREGVLARPPSHLFLIFQFFCLSLSVCFSSLLRARNRQITRLLENSLLISKLSLNQLPHHYFLFISQKPVDHHVAWGLPSVGNTQFLILFCASKSEVNVFLVSKRKTVRYLIFAHL